MHKSTDRILTTHAGSMPRGEPLGQTKGSQTRWWREVDSNLYGAFPCQVVFFGLLPVLCSERKGPFFIPSPTIRFRERAQWGQGTETLAKLGASPPSDACVSQRLDA
jgi:hypothetical protein